MHTPTVSTFDLTAKMRKQASSSKNVQCKLEACRLEPLGLYFHAVSSTVETDKDWRAMQAYVLPVLSLQIARFDWREDSDYDYYIDIVSVAETGQDRWVVRDLYLDILVFENVKLEIKDTGEYLEALTENLLDPSEAEHGLMTLHKTLNALGEHGYSLEAYLRHNNINLTWY